MSVPALLMRTSMAPACLMTSAMHAEMLAWEQTSKLTVLMPSSANSFKLSILWYQLHHSLECRCCMLYERDWGWVEETSREGLRAAERRSLASSPCQRPGRASPPSGRFCCAEYSTALFLCL